MICAGCLREETRRLKPDGQIFSRLSLIGQGLFGLALAWFLFFEAGRILLLIPSGDHAQTFWQSGGGDKQ